MAGLYINGVLQYTTPAGWVAVGQQRVLLYSNGGAATANLGASAFAYPVPAGFNAGLY